MGGEESGFDLVLEKRVTVGEILVLIGLIGSLIIAIWKSGEWKGSIEAHQVASDRLVRDVANGMSNLSQKVDDQAQQEQYNMDGLNTRLSRVEGKLNIAIGSPPYGPHNPPPIRHARPKPNNEDER